MFTLLFEGRSGRGRARNDAFERKLALNDPDAWKEAFPDEGDSESGVCVSAKKAIGYPPWWRGINLLSAGVAKLPFAVYRRKSDTDREKDLQHAAYKLLRRRPNRFLSAFHWKRTMQYHALQHGNGYSAIFFDGAGRPAELLLLDPRCTYPFQQNGELWYYTKAGDQERKLRASEVFHLKGLAFDGLVGHDVLEVMADALGLGLAARKFGARFFKHGAHAGGVLMIPRGMPEPAARRIKEDYDKFQAGLDNAFKTALLEEGTKWQQTTIDPEKSQLLNLLQYHVRDVANILGLPPHKLGDNSRLSYNSLEQENDAYLEDSLDPWLVPWEDEANCKLLSEQEQAEETHYCEFNRQALQRTDRKGETGLLVQQVNNGLLTPDEARAAQNRGPLPDGLGKKFRMPANLTILEDEPAAEPPPEPKPPEPPAGDDAPPQNHARDNSRWAAVRTANRALLVDRLERLQAVEFGEIRKAAARGGNFVEAVDKFYDRHAGRIAEAVQPVVDVMVAAGGHDAVDGRDMGKAFATLQVHNSRKDLLAAAEVPAGELVAAVEACLAGWADRANNGAEYLGAIYDADGE